MFQNAMMQMLAPFARDGGGPQSSPPPSAAQPAADKGFDDLKRQLDAMQRKLDELSKK
jgi:polyhydroxyalkanoate synthesis regulator protein